MISLLYSKISKKHNCFYTTFCFKLNNYSVKVKFDNGDVKDFDYINVDKLIKVDEDINDTSYNYEYSLLVKILPRSVIIGVAVMIVLGGLAALIVALKKHKKRII